MLSLSLPPAFSKRNDSLCTRILLSNGRIATKVLPIEIDAGLVPALLAKAKAIHELPTPPGRREGCTDCERTRALTLHA